jgi:hypothetical protein
MPVRTAWRGVALAVAVGLACSPHTAAQDQPSGMFVGTPDGPQELGVYANRTSGGGLRLAMGTLDEVHMVPGLVRVLCNLPFWRVRSAFIATGLVLENDRAERRRLTLRARQLSFTAMTVEVVDTEDPAKLKRLLDAVGATPENPAYVFVTMESRGAIRDYLVGIVIDP